MCEEDVLTEHQREPEKETIKAQVSQGLGEAREFAKSLDMEQVKSGEWFMKLLQKVVQAYDRNARTEYFQKKYPGLPPDEIADILISVTSRYATVAGGVAGATASAAQVSTLTTAGMTAPIFVGAIGSEMVYLARIQLRLILDLSVVYDLQLDPDDPEDVLMVFGYAMGVAPTELLGAAARVTRAALPYMRERKWGRIINVASESGVQPDPFMAHYNASKSALINLTKSLSKAYAAEGILVNAVSPAAIRTPLVEGMFEQAAREQGITTEDAESDFLTQNRPHIEIGRVGEPEEVGAVVAFLASEAASFVNGSNYRVDGGSVASL